MENIGWEAVDGITGPKWVDDMATHFHKMTSKILCQRHGVLVCCSQQQQEQREKGKETKEQGKLIHLSWVLGSLPVTSAAFHPPSMILQETLSVSFVLSVCLFKRKSTSEEKALINFLFMRRCEKILVSAGTELNSGCTRICIFHAALLQVTKIVPHSGTFIIWVIMIYSHSWCLDAAPAVLSWHSNATSNDNKRHGDCYSTFSPAVSEGP